MSTSSVNQTLCLDLLTFPNFHISTSLRIFQPLLSTSRFFFQYVVSSVLNDLILIFPNCYPGRWFMRHPHFPGVPLRFTPGYKICRHYVAKPHRSCTRPFSLSSTLPFGYAQGPSPFPSAHFLSFHLLGRESHSSPSPSLSVPLHSSFFVPQCFHRLDP